MQTEEQEPEVMEGTNGQRDNLTALHKACEAFIQSEISSQPICNVLKESKQIHFKLKGDSN